MSNEAKLIARYLQNECDDFWHVEEKDGVITCKYIDEFRFSVFKDEFDSWCITGTEINLNTAYNIAILLEETVSSDIIQRLS